MSDTGAGVQWVDTAEEEVVVVVTEDDTAAGRLEGPRTGPGSTWAVTGVVCPISGI